MDDRQATDQIRVSCSRRVWEISCIVWLPSQIQGIAEFPRLQTRLKICWRRGPARAGAVETLRTDPCENLDLQGGDGGAGGAYGRGGDGGRGTVAGSGGDATRFAVAPASVTSSDAAVTAVQTESSSVASPNQTVIRLFPLRHPIGPPGGSARLFSGQQVRPRSTAIHLTGRLPWRKFDRNAAFASKISFKFQASNRLSERRDPSMKSIVTSLMLFVLASSTPVIMQAQISNLRHIVIIFQENRTPDNLFQGLCGTNRTLCPNPYDIRNFGTDNKGQIIKLVQAPL